MRKNKITYNYIFDQLKKHDDLLKKYKVRKIGLFGSYARGDQNEKSDIDFLVEFEEPNFDNFIELVFSLEDLFRKRIELITKGNLSRYIEPYVNKEVKWHEI